MPFCHSCVFPILFMFPKDQLQDPWQFFRWPCFLGMVKVKWPFLKAKSSDLQMRDEKVKLRPSLRSRWWRWHLEDWGAAKKILTDGTSKSLTSWWFWIFFNVHPYLGMIFNLTKNLSDGFETTNYDSLAVRPWKVAGPQKEKFSNHHFSETMLNFHGVDGLVFFCNLFFLLLFFFSSSAIVNFWKEI